MSVLLKSADDDNLNAILPVARRTHNIEPDMPGEEIGTSFPGSKTSPAIPDGYLPYSSSGQIE